MNKSPVFYEKEKVGITTILDTTNRLSRSIDEKKDTSEEVFVRADADMLRLSLSKFLEYLLTCFVRNTPEMRLQQLKSATIQERSEIEERVQVEPIATEAKDFLNISVDRELSEKLKYEYFRQDIENQRIDIRFFYLGPDSVDLWFEIINRSVYKFNELGRENIKKNASELINVILENSPRATHVDFIDLGVGAAIKDFYLLNALLKRIPEGNDRMNYIPLDYSIAIIQKTMDYMDGLMDTYPNKLHIEGILGDFYRLIKYRDRINELSKSPKVFALLGNILGNVDEYRILTAVTKTMNSNDLFLLEIDLIDNRTDDELEVGYGTDDITKKFFLYPLLKNFKAQNKRTNTTIEDFELTSTIQDLSIIPNSKTVVTSASYGESNLEKIDLVRSHKYDLQSVLDYMYSSWKLEHIKTYTEKNSCLLLMRKKPIKVSTAMPITVESQLSKN